MEIVVYATISLLNVFLHTAKNVIIIKHKSKLVGSLSNCICYTFSAVVIKFIAQTDLWIALCVQAVTNFTGCYIALLFTEQILKNNNTMSKPTVKAKHKNGTTKHFIDCRYEERGDKIVIIHDEPDLENGGTQPFIQQVYDKSELESVTMEE